MAMRSTDPVISAKITREIPLWGILSFVGVIGSGALSLYTSNAEMVKQSKETTIAVKELTTTVNALKEEASGRKAADEFTKYRLDQLEARINNMGAKAK